MTPRPDPELLANLARELNRETDVTAILRRIVEASVAQVEGADFAGITVLSRSSVSTPVATDELVWRVDETQYALGEGPGLNAAINREPVVRVDNLCIDERWPRFAAAAVDLGVHSMLSFQLYTHRDALGSLNLYALRPNAFTEDSVHTGRILAAHAAIAASSTVQHANLRAALESRDLIGQAKGILMERFRVTPDQAFNLLIVASQRTNRKLRDIAEQLVATGELDQD